MSEERLSKLQKWILVQTLVAGVLSYEMLHDYYYEFGNARKDRNWFSDSLQTLKRTLKRLEEKGLIDLIVEEHWWIKMSRYRKAEIRLTEAGAETAERLKKKCLIIYRQLES